MPIASERILQPASRAVKDRPRNRTPPPPGGWSLSVAAHDADSREKFSAAGNFGIEHGATLALVGQ